MIQQARRDVGLSGSDRIRLTLDAPELVSAAARAHEALIRTRRSLDVGYAPLSDGVGGKVGEGVDVRVGIVWAG